LSPINNSLIILLIQNSYLMDADLQKSNPHWIYQYNQKHPHHAGVFGV